MTPEQFIAKWKPVTLTERSASQQHFIDLCRLLGEPTPAEADPTGETYTFEKGAAKTTGGNGWADVWRRGIFGWEYKGKGKDLQAAYVQLKQYADALENPPLLVTSDIQRIIVHTNFTNTVKQVHSIDLDELADPKKLEMLRWVFAEPEKLRPGLTRMMVTTAAAERFSEIAHLLQSKGHPPQQVAHFLNRLIFCMFSEDVGLLPNNVFNKMVSASVAHPSSFETYAKQLFGSMSKGGTVAFEVIDWFNGGLFDDDSTLPLDKPEIELLLKCADLDWTWIEPSIFGTLFERGLDPDKRSQQGTHYTDPATILKIVRPVVLDPWEQQWADEKAQLAKLLDNAKHKSDAALKRFQAFLEQLYRYRVLDPACGSGNFLYLALRGLKDFEKRVILEAEALGLPRQFPRIGPEAVLGIEVNPYAAELARVTVWIGEIQWMLENGFGVAKNPILKPLTQIECRDAVLNEDGTEPPWPAAHAIIGNPPFLGDRKIKTELGTDYATRLRHAYGQTVDGSVDLVCYWFDKARRQIRDGKTERVGLVSTNSIRGGNNRQVLEHIDTDTPIYEAWSDEPWVVNGAAVRVSIVCFARPGERSLMRLDGAAVEHINPDLSALAVDLSQARPLPENARVAFNGIQKTGPFEVAGEQARAWLHGAQNPHGEHNSRVLRPYWNGIDVTRRVRDSWIIDFTGLSEAEASLFERPFEHLAATVKPERLASTVKNARDRDWLVHNWWVFWRARPELAEARARFERVIVTPEVSKHRVFTWASSVVGIDKNLIAITRDDDTSFGILQSKVHECWTLRLCTWLGVGNDPRYTPSTVFETFPFPPGLTPTTAAASYASDPRAVRIAQAARRLDELRRTWLNPPELCDLVPDVVSSYPDREVPKNAEGAAELKKRTLTNLYNANPAWLQHAHRVLDEAVAAAYGWEWPMQEDEILQRLFELNQVRAKTSG